MTWDELEAVIRAQLTRVTSSALQAGVPSTGIMNRATEEILAAADACGLAEYGITAERRQVLADATAGITHYVRDGRPSSASVCGLSRHRVDTRWSGTADRGKVTCGACKRTGAWRAALREAS